MCDFHYLNRTLIKSTFVHSYNRQIDHVALVYNITNKNICFFFLYNCSKQIYADSDITRVVRKVLRLSLRETCQKRKLPVKYFFFDSQLTGLIQIKTKYSTAISKQFTKPTVLLYTRTTIGTIFSADVGDFSIQTGAYL